MRLCSRENEGLSPASKATISPSTTARREHPIDMALYVQGKTAIIIDILKRCELR